MQDIRGNSAEVMAMQQRRRMSAILTMVAVATLHGCGTGMHQQEDAQHQLQTLQRWAGCVERQSVLLTPVHDLDSRIATRCEDYHRDVLNAFPLHMENHLNRLLSERTSEIVMQRLVKTNAGDSWFGLQGTQIDTLKRRLRKTRQGNL